LLMLDFLSYYNVTLAVLKCVLYSVILSRWLMRNTIALSLNHHMTPEGALEQSLLVIVLVRIQAQKE